MNAITKKENGIVFTPEWVVDFMVDEALKSREITGNEKILDAGCGEGVFAVIAAPILPLICTVINVNVLI